ncbi:MAG: hypothetical protein GY754_40235 [bacterium]|nr:hypothetical protein [bacterium]
MGSDGARDYFEKLKIIEKFCGGDVEMAKMVLKGEYQDIIAIKGRFKDMDDGFFGLFLIFISKITKTVVRNFVIVSNSASLYLYKPFDNWRIFIDKLNKELNDKVSDTEKTEALMEYLDSLERVPFFINIFDWVEDNDIKNMTEQFQEVIGQIVALDDTEVLLDFETTTSLSLYEDGDIH